VSVNSANSPIASFLGNPNGYVNIGSTVVYTNTTNANGTNIVSVVWSIDTLGTSGTGNEFTQLFTAPGLYPVTITVTTSDGCVSTFTYTQVVLPEEIITPNVFSPNNDGKNDLLVFIGAEFYNSQLKVFNRWGQEVFSSGNYKNTWRGQDMPEGTYFYVLKLTETGKEYTGHVTLLR
jgi:gliding motility-associated-like protein